MARRNVKGGSYTPSRGAYKNVTFASRRAYENAIARDRGFSNKSQRNTRKQSVPLDFPSLEAFKKSKPGRAAEAFRTLRNDGGSLSAAARSAGTTPENVKRFYGDALERDGRKYRALGDDKAVIPMHITTVDGDRIAYVRGAADRSLVGRHSAAIGRVATLASLKSAKSARARQSVRKILQDELDPFRDATIQSADGNVFELLSDVDELKRLLRAGRIHADSPYDDKAA